MSLLVSALRVTARLPGLRLVVVVLNGPQRPQTSTSTLAMLGLAPALQLRNLKLMAQRSSERFMVRALPVVRSPCNQPLIRQKGPSTLELTKLPPPASPNRGRPGTS